MMFRELKSKKAQLPFGNVSVKKKKKKQGGGGGEALNYSHIFTFRGSLGKGVCTSTVISICLHYMLGYEIRRIHNF